MAKKEKENSKPKYYIISRTYELFPTKQMKEVLDRNCDYRRFCWNKGLEVWNDLYEAHTIFDKVNYVVFTPKYNKKTRKWHVASKAYHENPSPSWRLVRDRMVANKADWQFNYSAHLLQLAVRDLGKAWDNFFNKSQPDWGRPKFRSKREPRQGFKSDQAVITKDGRLRLEKPQGLKEDWTSIKMSEKPLPYPTGVMSFYREKSKYFVAVPYKVPASEFKFLPKTDKITGIDVNVGHFDYEGGIKRILPSRKKGSPTVLLHLNKAYEAVKHYQRQLARKRVINGKISGTKSRNYLQTRTKLQAAYTRCSNLQHDLMQKFTTELVRNYDQLAIENLDVKKMLMTHVASKGMHRSMFSLFRRLLTYKCERYGRKLIIAAKLYPSTQRCALCGLVKKGDEKVGLRGNKKHHTKHNEFICYNPKCPNYLKKVDRDQNAMLNLTLIIKHPELNRPCKKNELFLN